MISNKKIIWSLAGNSVDIAIGLGSVLLITRIYPEEVAGQWFIFVAIFSLLTNLREGFVQNGLVKYSVNTDENTQFAVYKTNLVSNLIFELLCSTSVLILFQLFDWYQLKTLFLFYPIYSIPYSIYRWIFVVHRSQLRVEKSTLMNSVFLVTLSIGGGLLFIYEPPLHFMIFVLGFASLFAGIAGFFSLEFRKILQKKFDLQMFRLLLVYGKHGILRELTGTVSTKINIFLSAGLLSYTQTAYLGVSQRYLMLLLIPNNAFQALLYPVLVKISNSNDREFLKNEFENQVSRLLSAMIILATFLIIVSPIIIQTLHGESYKPAVGLLMISLITITLFSPFGSAFGSMVNAIEKPNLNSLIVIVNSIINIALSYILIRSIGLYGAVIAPFFTEVFGFLWAAKILRSSIGINYFNCYKRIPQQYSFWLKKVKLTLVK